MKVLAGDIGGTKTILQIANIEQNRVQVEVEKSYPSQKYNEFIVLLNAFLEETSTTGDNVFNSACFGVAGPVRNQVVKTTNLPWVLDAKQLAKDLGIATVLLINDFQAIGYGIEALKKDDVLTLQEGHEEDHGVRAVIGAGTGLGEGILYWDNDHYEYLPSEGGHADFAPRNTHQIGLLEYLIGHIGQVSYEHVLSGSGLVSIYSFLCVDGPTKENPQVRHAMETEDPAAVISRFALEQKDPLSTEALDLFCHIYGAQAGNLALTSLAVGGVYVAGGIAPKIINKLTDGTFLRAFNKNLKMSSLLENMPVKVVLNPKVGLIGAARTAARSSQKGD